MTSRRTVPEGWVPPEPLMTIQAGDAPLEKRWRRGAPPARALITVWEGVLVAVHEWHGRVTEYMENVDIPLVWLDDLVTESGMWVVEFDIRVWRDDYSGEQDENVVLLSKRPATRDEALAVRNEEWAWLDDEWSEPPGPGDVT